MSRIVISSGHGKHVAGAAHYLDEVTEARRIVDHVADILSGTKVECVSFHDNSSDTQSENLDTIIDFHNQHERDLDVSVHLNSYQVTDKPMGTEVCYLTQQGLAAQMSAAIADAGGLIDRGSKRRNDLAFLNRTEAPAVLIEVAFVDSRADITAYAERFDQICGAIADTIVAWLSNKAEQAGKDEDEPTDVPLEKRPTLARGDSGADVEDMQELLPNYREGIDGDFGPGTEQAVADYQRSRGLVADGICGPDTWRALYERAPVLFPLPRYPEVAALSGRDQRAIRKIAHTSVIASYAWKD